MNSAIKTCSIGLNESAAISMKTRQHLRALLGVSFLAFFSLNAEATTVINTLLNGPNTDVLCRNNDHPSLVQNCWTAGTTAGHNFLIDNPSNVELLGPDGFGPLLDGLTDLYRAESFSDKDGDPLDPLRPEPAAEIGSLQNSYSTTFLFSSNDDYHGATISYDGGPSVDCSVECYLVIKDGKHNPAGYLFDLALGWDPLSPLGDGNGWAVDNGVPSWNGIMDLTLKNLWLGGGSISYVALYGNISAVPVPAAFWLFGTALLGFIGLSRTTRV